MKKLRFALAVLALAAVCQAGAQTSAEGPWWPSRWGPEDQAGSSNWITPDKVMESIALVKTGKIYELGQVYERGMPLYGKRTYSLFIPSSPTGGPVGNNDFVFHDELLVAEIGQVGTQFDGLGHVGRRLRMADGTTQDVFYNGFTAAEMRGDILTEQGPYGLDKLGVEQVRPFITRGLLIDIAGYKGVASLDHAYEVTVADVRGALKKQGMAESGIRPGDALLFRYGWSIHWKDPAKYNREPPGIGMEVAEWIVAKQPSMIGSDQWMTEVDQNPSAAADKAVGPVHLRLITEEGIMNLENMVFDALVEDEVYEFLFVFTPIRFKGATGSPVAVASNPRMLS